MSFCQRHLSYILASTRIVESKTLGNVLQSEALHKTYQQLMTKAPDYSTSDFVEDVKRACAREAVHFDNDMFQELAR